MKIPSELQIPTKSFFKDIFCGQKGVLITLRYSGGIIIKAAEIFAAES